MSDKGVFITLEGGDGSGKTTQLKLLQSALAQSGIDAVFTREPGGTDQAEKIRSLILQRDSGDFDPVTEALLMFAARREHLVNKIWPEMEKGKWVVSDRFADSSRAFQGYGHGLDLSIIERLYDLVVGDFKPDLTFILDIDPENGVSRSMKHMAATTNKRESTEDRFERMALSFHTRLRDGYLKIAAQEPQRCVVIDAAQSIDVVHKQIITEISRRFDRAVHEAKAA